MTLPLEQEIGALRSLYWSDRDPEGRVFAPLADALRRAGELRQAISLLREGLARHPDYTTGHVVAARLYLEAGLASEAEVSSRRALDLDPENLVALECLAGALEARGVPDEAAEVRRQLTDIMAPSGGALPHEPPVDGGTAVEPEALAPDEPVVELEALAPDEPVVELEALAPDDPVLEMGALAPDEPVLEMEALAPDEPVLELEALAPDEPVLEMEALAPDDPVLEMGALAPDEPVLELEALAPDEPVLEMEALAPDEPVLEMEALAPDEPVLDIGELVPQASTPGFGAVSIEIVRDTSALAPDEVVFDLDELAPDPAGAPRPSGSGADEGGVGPGPMDDLVDFEGLLGGEVASADEAMPTDEPEDDLHVVTRTMAELFVRQGLTDRAVDVYRQLVAAAPQDETLANRLRELQDASGPRGEAAGPGPFAGPPPPPSGAEDEDLAHHAWHADAHAERHDVDTPFAWTEEEAEDASTLPPVSGYFARLLSWEPRTHGWEGAGTEPGDREASDGPAGRPDEEGM